MSLLHPTIATLNVNIINNKQNTTYPFSKNLYIRYYQRVMNRKSGVWSSVGDDGESSQEREFLRWSEKRGLTPLLHRFNKRDNCIRLSPLPCYGTR